MHSDEALHSEIRSRLTALIEATPIPRRSTLETTLEPHRELITQAYAKGHNYRSITDTLRGAGLKASPETIRRYLQRITKTTSESSGRPKRKHPVRETSRHKSDSQTKPNGRKSLAN